MGNCVPSAQKTTEPAMQVKSSITSQENSLRIESPIKDNNVKGDLSMTELNSKLKSSSPTPYGLSNGEEIFFDSQPWMDSDIEDFLSVNGGFTPLEGTTPLHQNSLINYPQVNESVYVTSNVNSLPESSPTDMKKQLIEFFHESFSSDVDDNQDLPDKTETKPVACYLPSKCRKGNYYEVTPNGYFNRKPADSEAQCCFPNLVRSFSFSERKKRLKQGT